MSRPANPWRAVQHFAQRREIIWQFTVREVQGRYRGSYLGIIWSLINPLLTLAVYTFVFSVVFHTRWQTQQPDTNVHFSLILFSGMIAFNVFSECTARAPALIRSNPNFVKKVVFPLEVLPLSVLGAALFHSLIGVVLVIAGLLISAGTLHWTILYLPLIYVPLIALTLGCSWVFASVGVFLRDIESVIAVALQMLFFLTPVVYPLSAVPASLQPLLCLNPLALLVEQFRRVLVWGLSPDWTWLAVEVVVCGLAMVGGYLWFMKIKVAFADVI